MKFWRKQETPPDAEGYVLTDVAAADVTAGEMVTVKVNGRSLILTRLDGNLHAVSRECPHAAADLAKGELHRWKLYCPDHSYCFDVRNGRILWPEDEPLRLKSYPVKVEDGRIKVKVM